MTFDIVALAKRINDRREEWNHLHPDRTVRVSPAMSRILENDPDYLPYRERRPAKRHRPVTNPSIATLVTIAAALGTSVGDLLGEPVQVAPADRVRLARAYRTLESLLRQQMAARE